MNQDLRDYIAFLIGHGLRIAFSTIGMAILARLLGPDGLGRWAMVTAAATLLHLALISWLQQDTLLRFGREEWVAHGTVRKTWSALLPFMVGGILVAFLLFALAPGDWMKRIFLLSPMDRCLAFAFFLSIVVMVESQMLCQIAGRMRLLAFAPAVVSGFSALFYFGLRLKAPITSRLELSLLGTIAITIGIWGGAALYEKNAIHWGLARWDPALAKKVLYYAWPLLPTAILGYIVNWGNQVLIRHSFSNRDVGLYQAAFQVHSLVTSLAVPLTTIILPKLIGRHFEDPTIMHRYVRTATPTLFSLWLLVTIPGVAILPAVFIRVFGRSYIDSLPVLAALLISTPLCAVGQLYTGLYTVQNKMEKVLLILIATVAINLAAVWPALRHGSIRGVAEAFCLGFSAAQILTYFYQHHVLKESTRTMNALVISAVVFSLGQSVLYSFPLRIFWGFAGLCLLIIVVRETGASDAQTLDRLFTGRLVPIGDILGKLFNKKGMAPGPA